MRRSIWAFTFLFVATVCQVRGDSPPKNAAPAPNVAATVNGELIRLDQVDSVVRRMPVRGPLTDGQARRLRREVVEDMIDDVLLRQFLRQHGPKVDRAEVEKHFRGLAATLQRQGKSLAEFYRETGQTEAQVRDTWATMYQFQKYADEQAKGADLRKYFETNRDFFDGTTVRVSHIVARVGPSAPPGDRIAARERLTAIRADVLAEKLTFAEAAKKYSIDPSAPTGGDLGFIGRRDGIVDEAVAQAAFALKVGEVSQPVETDYGFHLVRVAERKPGAAVTFEKVSDLVRECYAGDVRQSLVAVLRQKATIQVTIP
jgi:parvulin-like peptidyl-prolyl isomerase